MSPYGVTKKEITALCERLSAKLDIKTEQVETAFMDIIREDVLRIAKNAPEEE